MQALDNFYIAQIYNNDQALYNLGYCFMNGYGLNKNLKKAKEYFEKSALRGNIDAGLQFILLLI